jgi:hypothetical protein
MSQTLISNLKLLHTYYNLALLFLFLCLACLGIIIRGKRLTGKPKPFKTIKFHRNAGSFLAFFGILGFFSGVTMILIDKGNLLTYPLHFAFGFTIAFLIFLTYLISKKIKADSSEWRTKHFITGILIVCLYILQAFLVLGLGVLL